VEELCRLIREVQPGQDKSRAIFQRSHLVRLLSVELDKRAALQKRCINKGWTRSELEAEIARRFGTRRQGGRRRKIPPDLTGLLIQLEHLCEVWRRWIVELSRDREERNKKHVLLEDVPDNLRKQIEAIRQRMWTLHQDVVAELKQVQPGRKLRYVLQGDAEDQKKTAGQGGRKG
jgi:hypothetical protein